jgi:Na+/H+ antiporter NhaD/arsenite permease-like protein
MIYFCNYVEKLKNLLLWKEKQKTLFFLILLIILSFVVNNLPIRYLIMYSVFQEFQDGRKYYQIKENHN